MFGRALGVSLILLRLDLAVVGQEEDLGECLGGCRNQIGICRYPSVLPRPPLQDLVIESVIRDTKCCITDGFIEEDERTDVFPFLETGCPKKYDVKSICRGVASQPGILRERSRLIPGDSERRDPSGTPPPVRRLQGQPVPPVAGQPSLEVFALPTACVNIYSGGCSGVGCYECSNELIGDPQLAIADLSPGTSIVTAGNVVVQASQSATPGGSSGRWLIGGNLQLMPDSTEITLCTETDIPNCETNIAVPFTGFGLWVGGVVNFEPNPSGVTFTVALGNVALSDVEYISYAAPSFPGAGQISILFPEDVAEGRASIQAKLCSAATQLSLAPNSGYAIGVGEVEFVCDENGQEDGTPCVIDVSKEFMEEIFSFTIDTANYDGIYVRISGDGEINVNTVEQGQDAPLTFFFAEADSINVRAGQDEGLVMFAPHATSVTINYEDPSAPSLPVGVSILMGHPRSEIIFNNFGTTEQVPPTLLLPVARLEDEQKVTCNCACDPNVLPARIIKHQCFDEGY